MKQLFLLFALLAALTIGALAQNNDVYVPLPKDNFDLNLNTAYAGIVYTNSVTHKTPRIAAWQYDSLTFAYFWTDSVSVSSIKVIRYASMTATSGDTSATYGTVVSTNTGGKTYFLSAIDTNFTNKNAGVGYIEVLTAFNSSGNAHAQYSKKYYMYAHGYNRKK